MRLEHQPPGQGTTCPFRRSAFKRRALAMRQISQTWLSAQWGTEDHATSSQFVQPDASTSKEAMGSFVIATKNTEKSIASAAIFTLSSVGAKTQ